MVLGYASGKTQTAKLVIRALNAARATGLVAPDAIFHSDHGVQYRSKAFTRACGHRIRRSMGAYYQCWDNAIAYCGSPPSWGHRPIEVTRWPCSISRCPQHPGMSIASSAPDVLGDRAWFRWKATLGTGESFQGVDFVEFAPDGRIARLTGFYEE